MADKQTTHIASGDNTTQPSTAFISRGADNAVGATQIPSVESGVLTGRLDGSSPLAGAESSRVPSISSIMASIPSGAGGDTAWRNFANEIVNSKDLANLGLDVISITSPVLALFIRSKKTNNYLVYAQKESIEASTCNNRTSDNVPLCSLYDAAKPHLDRLAANRGAREILETVIASHDDLDRVPNYIAHASRLFMQTDASVGISAQSYMGGKLHISLNRTAYETYMENVGLHAVRDRDDICAVIYYGTESNKSALQSQTPIAAFTCFTNFASNGYGYIPFVNVTVHSILPNLPATQAAIAIAIDTVLTNRLWSVPYRTVTSGEGENSRHNLGLLYRNENGLPTQLVNSTQINAIINGFAQPYVVVRMVNGAGNTYALNKLLTSPHGEWNRTSNEFVSASNLGLPALLDNQNLPGLLNSTFLGTCKFNGNVTTTSQVDYLTAASSNPKNTDTAVLLNQPILPNPVDSFRNIQRFAADAEAIYTVDNYAVSDDALHPIITSLRPHLVTMGNATGANTIDLTRYAAYGQSFVNSYNTNMYYQSPYNVQANMPMMPTYPNYGFNNGNVGGGIVQ